MPHRPRFISALVFLAAVAPASLAATTQPTTITLRVTDAPAKTVVAEFARQAGGPIPVAPPELLDKPTLGRVTLDLDRQPFWAAMRSLSRAAGLEPVVSPEDAYPRLRLGQGTGAFWEGPHALAGPLVLFATDVSRTTTVELGKTRHAVDRELALSLTAYVEPGLRVLGASQEVVLQLAVDETGRSLLPAAAEDGPTGSPVETVIGGGLFTWNLSAGLRCPDPVGKRIAKLRGVTHVRLQTRSETVEIDDVLKSRSLTRPVAGVPFTFKSLKKTDAEYILQVHLRRDKKPEPEWQLLHQSLYNGMLALYDDKGRLVAARANENGGDYANARIDATLRFVREAGVSDPNAGEPYKLVWHAPLAAVDLPVAFELTDLPIPD